MLLPLVFAPADTADGSAVMARSAVMNLRAQGMCRGTHRDTAVQGWGLWVVQTAQGAGTRRSVFHCLCRCRGC